MGICEQQTSMQGLFSSLKTRVLELADFVFRYLEDQGRFWETNDHDFVQLICEGFFYSEDVEWASRHLRNRDFCDLESMPKGSDCALCSSAASNIYLVCAFIS